MTAAVRKPKPRAVPTTLAELVLDLDSRLEGESVACDVWLPAEEWERLLARAVDERHPAPNFGPVAPDEKVRLEFAELLGQRQLEREDLARALGCGADTEWPDLVQIAKGYAMALEVERERYVRRVAELGNQATLRPADRPDEDEHPPGCKVCKTSPYVLRVNGVELAGHYADRDVAEQDGRRRCIGGFEVYEPRKQQVWDRYTRCETCDEVTDGHVTSSCPKAKVEEPEEQHPECPHCGEADGHAPKDCAMREDERPTMVESMAKAKLEEQISWSKRRLNGQGWKREAKKARELLAMDVCHHCGARDDEDECLVVRNEPPLPDATLCAGCRALLTEKPSDWLRHAKADAKAEPPPAPPPAEAAPKKRRATKKFPLGGDPLELCTVCGASYGDHDGQRCPKKQRRMKYVDEPATAEAPF